MHAAGNYVLRGLAAENHSRMAVKENEFRSGPVTCNNTDDLVMVGNSAVGAIEISASTGGMICNNRVHGQGDSGGDLTIVTASGHWKVADNRVDRLLRIHPGLQWRGRVSIADIFTTVSAGLQGQAFHSLAALEQLTADERFTAIIYPQPAVEIGEAPGVATNVARAASPAPGTATYAVSSENWAANYQAAMVNFVLAGRELPLPRTSTTLTTSSWLTSVRQSNCYTTSCVRPTGRA